MPFTGIIILCHGSRGHHAIDDLPVKMKSLVDGIVSLISGDVVVAWAALQFNHPTFEESAASLVARGVKSIVVVPYFLFSGRHIQEDIPEVIKRLTDRYPGLAFSVTRALGDKELFIPQIIKRISEVTPDLWTAIQLASVPPATIEHRSMEIIERLLSQELKFRNGEKAIVKRVIHACGDPQVAELINFSPEAVSSGIDAIENGRPIFTDVRMVATGINSHIAEACGCLVMCGLDEVGDDNNSSGNSTRAATSIRYLGARLHDAIVAIGNAPTALLALIDLIDNYGVRPALVVGMPVGFVQAKESKEELMKRDVPYITVIGTRGGSSMAAATVNALLKIASEKQK